MEKFEGKKFDIFEKLKELNFPLGKYVVVGSGTLDALGIRPASDVDIAVAKDLLDELKKDDSWQKEEHFGKTFLQKGLFTIIPELNWEKYDTTVGEAIDSAMTINGFPFMNLEELLKFKKALNREKDQKDIKLLEDMLKEKK